MHAQEVIVVDLEWNRERIAEVPSQPSGLGWLPNGVLPAVSMADRKLPRRSTGFKQRSGPDQENCS